MIYNTYVNYKNKNVLCILNADWLVAKTMLNFISCGQGCKITAHKGCN